MSALPILSLPGVAACVVASNTQVNPSSPQTFAQLASDPTCLEGVKLAARKSKKGDLFGKYCKAYLALKDLESCIPDSVIHTAMHNTMAAPAAADGGTGGAAQMVVPFVPLGQQVRGAVVRPADNWSWSAFLRSVKVWFDWAHNHPYGRYVLMLFVFLFPKLCIKWLFRNFRIAFWTGASETVATVSETFTAAASAVESASSLVDEAIEPVVNLLPMQAASQEAQHAKHVGLTQSVLIAVLGALIGKFIQPGGI